MWKLHNKKYVLLNSSKVKTLPETNIFRIILRTFKQTQSRDFLLLLAN
jgi:hypothetical protein